MRDRLSNPTSSSPPWLSWDEEGGAVDLLDAPRNLGQSDSRGPQPQREKGAPNKAEEAESRGQAQPSSVQRWSSGGGRGGVPGSAREASG